MLRPRLLAALSATSLLLLLTSCAGSSPQALDPSAHGAQSPDAMPQRVAETALLGLYDLAWDPTTQALTVEEARYGTATSDRYQIPLDSFLTGGSLRLIDIARTADTLSTRWQLRHPFAGPTDLSGPANASNRADLGIVPRLVVLADLPASASVADYTWFGSVIARPGVVPNSDGYCQSGQLVPAAPGRRANTFPFVMAVDEVFGGTGNRIGISSGGVGQGNYAPASGGWQAANIGPSRNGWTGYGVLHQGQTVTVPLDLVVSLFETPGVAPLQVAVLAQYLDPRGGTTATEKRANRLPVSPADVMKFVYRMPHGAPDVSRVVPLGTTGTLQAENPSSSVTMHVRVTDFDLRAPTTASATLASDPNPGTVMAGAAGAPTVRCDIPGVTATPATLTLTDDDTPYGGDVAADSGMPEDPVYFNGSVFNSAATPGQSEGPYWALVEVRDPEAALDRSSYEFPLDSTLTPVASGLLPVTWQFAPVTLDAPFGCALRTLTFTFDDGAEGWAPWGTNSDQYDWSHFRQGCANAATEAIAAGALSAGGTYLSTGDDQDNAECDFTDDYGPHADATFRSPLITLPHMCDPGELRVRFNAVLAADSDATASFYATSSDRDPGTPLWTRSGNGGVQVLTDVEVSLSTDLAAGPLRLWFRFQGGTDTYQTAGGEHAGLSIDHVRLLQDSDEPIKLGYTPPFGTCLAQNITQSFDLSAEGWQGGQFFGLPNGDDQATIRQGLGGLGSFRWTACDAATDPLGTYSAVLAAAVGAISGPSLNISADQDQTDGGLGTGCQYLDDFGGNAVYNIVSPRYFIPSLCSEVDESTFRWNAYLNTNAVGGMVPSTIRLYLSGDNGQTWGSPVWSMNSSNGGTVAINQQVYLEDFEGSPQGVRARFEFVTTAASVRQAPTPTQAFGCYIDQVRVAITGSETLLLLP
ncbi:MAG: hypothetical protein GEEBNDBF_02015 [bacterium]|nr:hypothetical protein [bacterium]